MTSAEYRNVSRFDDETTVVRPRPYVYNITINGIVYNFTNSSPYSYFSPAYCYDDLILFPYQLKETPYCFNEDYFVW